MQAHRFYLPPARCAGDLLRLDGQEARHALRVLRLNSGDPATVLDGDGNELIGTVESTSRDSLFLRIKTRHFAPPLPCSVTLFVGIPRGKIIESIIQKSVELGARKIVPLLTERVITRLDSDSAGQKREQWQQVAIEAMKQCGAPRLPEIAIPANLGHVLAQTEKPELQIVGSLQKERQHPRDIFNEYEKAGARPPQSAAIWIGPEGDFTLDELQAIQKFGAHSISLGRLVLRVETAAIYCLSIVNYEFNAADGAGSGSV